MKLTPWFDADTKPVRPGVYERTITNLPFYSRWNGRYWCVGRFDASSASRQRTRSSAQSCPWRGLMENPHA